MRNGILYWLVLRSEGASLLRRVAAVLVMAGWTRLAAAADGYDAPTVDKINYWWSVLAAVVGLAAIAVLAFKNAKRTHLD